jgi:hypothetical protein
MEIELLAGQRQKNESEKAVQACNDWLRLGSGRTLCKLLDKYAELHRIAPPTTSKDTLKKWSTGFNWANRQTEYDANWEQIKTAKRNAVMEYGLALDYERVDKLKRLSAFLESQLYEQGKAGEYHNVWLPDVKQIGSGEYVERVDIERFNGVLISEYRAVLNDLAKEVGGRVHKQEHKVETWEDRAIEDIRKGVIGFDDLQDAFDTDLATQLFARAGVSISNTTD